MIDEDEQEEEEKKRKKKVQVNNGIVLGIRRYNNYLRVDKGEWHLEEEGEGLKASCRLGHNVH